VGKGEGGWCDFFGRFIIAKHIHLARDGDLGMSDGDKDVEKDGNCTVLAIYKNRQSSGGGRLCGSITKASHRFPFLFKLFFFDTKLGGSGETLSCERCGKWDCKEL